MQLELPKHLCAILALLLVATACDLDDEPSDTAGALETPVETASTDPHVTDVPDLENTTGEVESDFAGDDSHEAAEAIEVVEDELDESDLQDWNRHQSSDLGLSFYYPAAWQTLNEFDGTLFLSNLDAMAAGRGPELPPNSIFLTIYPHVDRPAFDGNELTVGQQDYPAAFYKSDPWGYRQPDLTVDTFYSASGIDWLVRAHFSEPANDENALYLELRELLETIEHHEVVDPIAENTPIELYDEVTAYWDRIDRDTVSLIQERKSTNDLLSQLERESELWRDDFEHSLAQWDSRYFDALTISPPQGMGGVHARYLRAHFYHEVLRLMLYDWLEGNPASSQSHFGAISASLVAMNLTLLYGDSPDLYGGLALESSISGEVAALPRWGGGLIHDYMMQHFGVDDSLWTLARLHLQIDGSTASLVEDHLTPQGHKVFVYKYVSGLGDEDSAIPSLGFWELGEVLNGFLNGTGEWSGTHLYQSMERAKDDGNHFGEYAVLQDLVDAFSYTMSDNRYLAFRSSVQDLFDHYLANLDRLEGSGTFSELVIAVGERSLIGRYYEFGD